MSRSLFLLSILLILISCRQSPENSSAVYSGNPLFEGWYADPASRIYNDTFWIFPTYSDYFHKQVFFDCFSSPDLVNWTRHERIIDTTEVTWADSAMWAPASIKKEGKYYFFFAANDMYEGDTGGIGVAVSDRPQGPYRDYLGEPLIGEIVNGAQPIDQYVFQDKDGTYYMYYGGWGRCNVVRLNDDFTGLEPFDDGTFYREITPEDYVEGPFIFIRDGKYYFMWSEGNWSGPHYRVAYAISDNPFGPFEREGVILQQDPDVARGAGHHSVIEIPGEDEYYIIYHRRPLEESHRNHRVVCIERLEFDSDGKIKPVQITFSGVPSRSLTNR